MKKYWTMTDEELQTTSDSLWEEVQSLRKSLHNLSVDDPKRNTTHRRLETVDTLRTKAIQVSVWRRLVDDNEPRVYLVGEREYDMFEMMYTSLDAEEAFLYYLEQESANSIEFYKIGHQSR